MKIIEKFADEVIASGAYKELDRVYVINKIKALVGDEDQEYDGKQSPVKQLVQIAVDRKIIPDDNTSREVLNDKLYDLKTPTPSKVNEIFWQKMQKSANAATDWFYKLCVDNNYVKKEAIAKNIVFSGKSSKNHELEITINLSKPEKILRRLLRQLIVPVINILNVHFVLKMKAMLADMERMYVVICE